MSESQENILFCKQNRKTHNWTVKLSKKGLCVTERMRERVGACVCVCGCHPPPVHAPRSLCMYILWYTMQTCGYRYILLYIDTYREGKKCVCRTAILFLQAKVHSLGFLISRFIFSSLFPTSFNFLLSLSIQLFAHSLAQLPPSPSSSSNPQPTTSPPKHPKQLCSVSWASVLQSSPVLNGDLAIIT